MTQEPTARPYPYGTEAGEPAGPTDEEQRRSVEVESRPASMKDEGSLLPMEESGRYRARWDSVQASFVDEPREAAKEAQQLLEEVFRSLTDAFARERSVLESRWESGEEVSTEDLRVTLQRYRTIFQKLLAA